MKRRTLFETSKESEMTSYFDIRSGMGSLWLMTSYRAQGSSESDPVSRNSVGSK